MGLDAVEGWRVNRESNMRRTGTEFALTKSARS